MRSGLRDTLLFAAYLAAGLLAALIAARLTVGGELYLRPGIILHWLAAGFSGALIYISVRTRGLLLALLMVIVLIAGNVLLSNLWTPVVLASVAIRSVSIGVAFIGSACVFRAMRRIFLGKFLFMAAFLATAFAFNTVAVLLLHGRPVTADAMLGEALAGLRLGALSGFLFELVDFIGLKLGATDARPS